jgi:hypothetical protein
VPCRLFKESNYATLADDINSSVAVPGEEAKAFFFCSMKARLGEF